MQDELVRIKQSTGTTLIHVTHDQEEACAIADRIAVMKDGMIAQIDTPEALYRAPRNSYVASFIDAGTIVRGRNIRDGSSVEVSHPDIELRGRLPPHRDEPQSMAADCFIVEATIPSLPTVRTVQDSTTVELPVVRLMPKLRQPETEMRDTSTFTGGVPE